MEKKAFKNLLKMPSPRSRSPPGSEYSAAEEYASPTAADIANIKKRQVGQELQRRFEKDMEKAGNQADFDKLMTAKNPYLNGGRKTRRRRRKSRKTRKH